LRDNLADSGLISLLVVERIGTSEIEVKEFNISCRAIGRGLESAIFEKSLRSISYSRDEYPIKVYVTYKAGPRNSPVLEWMKSLRFLETEGRFVIHLEETRSLNEK
jgi:predicted enzyme involved in methoxymalonyl-ACP biosynthesis